jgi:MFS family permease
MTTTVSTKKSAGIRLIFRSFQSRNYRLFFGGQGISLIGTWIQRIAVPWLVYDLTNSAFLLGIVGFAGQIPTFLIAPFAGVLTDRWNKYHIMIATQVAAMIQALVLAMVYFSGHIHVWHIVSLNILLGCINAFDTPARQSFVIEMIEKKEDLGNAIALNSSLVNGARLIGPSIAGMLIAWTGEGICFLLNGLSYIFVIASLLMMRVTPKKTVVRDSRVLADLREGVCYALSFKPIKHIIYLLALVSLMGMSYTVLMPVLAKEVLHGGPHTFGFLMGALGLGAFSGALYLASRKSIVGLCGIIPWAAGIFGVGLIAFSFSRTLALSLVLMGFIGVGMMMQMASSNTILQTIVDDDKRGRVMSLYTMAFMGTAPFGSFLAGSLAKLIGTTHTVLLGGILCTIGALLFARKLPEIRRIIRPIYIRLGVIPAEISQGIQSASEMAAEPKE